MVGQDQAVLVLTTVDGRRVGVPIGVNALTYLQGVITEALRMLQAGDGNALQ